MKNIKEREEDSFKLLGKRFKVPSLEDVDIDMKELVHPNVRKPSAQAEELPFQLEWVGIVQAKAEKNAKLAEIAFRVWEASRARRARSKAVELKKKLSEKEVEATIRRDPQYAILKKAQFDAEEQRDIMKSVYWALGTKKDIIIEFLRKEAGQSKLNNLRVS